MSSRTHIFLLMIALFSTARLAAQAEEATWRIRVAAIDIAGGHDTLWLRTGEGKEPVEVPLNTRVFSPPIEYKGGARLDFHASAADASAEIPPHPLASTILKANPSLLVFAPDEEGKAYRIFAVADGEFPFGSFRLVNFSAAAVRAEFAGKLVTLKPGAAETLIWQEGGQAIPVRLTAMLNGGESRIVRQSSWSIVPNQRELVLFLPNEQNGFVRLRHFVDSKDEIPPR